MARTPPPPADRSTLARMAAHALYAQVDATEHTAPARKAFLDSFEEQVDPDGLLDPAERARRAAHLRKSYFYKMAVKSAQARRRTDVGGDAA